MKKFVAGVKRKRQFARLVFVESVTKDMPRSLLYKSFRNKRIRSMESEGKQIPV